MNGSFDKISLFSYYGMENVLSPLTSLPAVEEPRVNAPEASTEL